MATITVSTLSGTKYMSVSGEGTLDNPYRPINDVFIQDQSTELIDLFLTKEIQSVTIASLTNIGDTTITITSASEPINGNLICLKEGSAFYQGRILSHSANSTNWDVVLDTPLDFAFTLSGGCSERSSNMNVNGSVTPQIFTITPSGLTSGTKWDITRVLFAIEDEASMDSTKFGGIAKLTKGIVLRKKDGVYKNIMNIKDNGEFAERAFDISYDDRASPSGKYFFRCRKTFAGQEKSGVVIRLESDTNDELQVIIQDDLTALTKFRCVLQGHTVE